jgi:tetratricopeptide (TPR) repeat protein
VKVMRPVRNPKIDTLIRKGEKHLNEGRFEDALRIFDFALKLDDKNEKLLEYKSIALNELDRVDEAFECLEQIAEINPEKKKWLAEARKNPEIDRCDKLMDDAEILVAEQQYKKAISNYREVIQSDPTCTDAYMNIGICYDHLGDYSSAIDFYDMALEIYPLYPKAWLNKAITYQHTGDITDALICYDKAIELDKNYSLAYYNKGVLLIEYGDHRRALECFTKTLEIDPENDSAKYNADRCIDYLE